MDESRFLESNWRQSEFREQPAVTQEAYSGARRSDPASEEVSDDWPVDVRRTFEDLSTLIDETAYQESLRQSGLAIEVLDHASARATEVQQTLNDLQDSARSFWDEHELLETVQLINQACTDLDVAIDQARSIDRELSHLNEQCERFLREYRETFSHP